MRLNLERSGPWIGAAGLFVVLWLVITTPFLFAPWWGFLLHVVLLACFVPVELSWARTRPAMCVWVPVMAFAAWVGLNAVGIYGWGWSLDG